MKPYCMLWGRTKSRARDSKHSIDSKHGGYSDDIGAQCSPHLTMDTMI